MPIRRHHRWLYPIDWRELSLSIRFLRAAGRCERCGQPHGCVVVHLGDGRWWDEDVARWGCGAGRWVRRLKPPHSIVEPTRRTRGIMAYFGGRERRPKTACLAMLSGAPNDGATRCARARWTIASAAEKSSSGSSNVVTTAGPTAVDCWADPPINVAF